MIGEPDLRGFRTAYLPPRVGQLGRHTRLHDVGQALQGADVGHDTEVNLLDGKVSIGATVAQIAGRGDGRAAADGPAVHRREHRFATALDAGNAILNI